MNYNKDAEKNIEEIDPDFNEELEKTDGEFIELFRNFLFGEATVESKLDKRSQFLVVIATLITNQSLNLYKKIVKTALNNGISPIEIKEVLYQSTAYIGMSKVYDFLDVTNEIFKDNGIDLPLEGQSTTNFDNRKEKGYKIQCDYFGKENIDAMIDNAISGQEHFNTFLADYCFGDFYTRTGLSDQDRELITFTFIANLRGCENQLRGHTAGNLAVGNDKDKLIGAITIMLPFIGFPRTLNAVAIVNEVCTQ
jgi:4-carboxymuconolactone decarboxylase